MGVLLINDFIRCINRPSLRRNRSQSDVINTMFYQQRYSCSWTAFEQKQQDTESRKQVFAGESALNGLFASHRYVYPACCCFPRTRRGLPPLL